MVRKSSRRTAGLLPLRYRDDDNSSTPDRHFVDQEEEYIPTPSSMPSSTPIQTPQKLAVRGRGRPRTRDTKSTAEEVQRQSHEPANYPLAAFPTKDHPSPNSAKVKVHDESPKRDSMDIKRPLRDQSPPLGQRLNKVIGGYLYKGAYIDREGHTMHFLAEYYDNHASEYERERRDQQGDAKDKNAAFRTFMETPLAQQAQLEEGKAGLMAAFQTWWASGAGLLAPTGNEAQSNGMPSGKTSGTGFRDQAFEALHFKLQWCIILEIEDDLKLYPPKRTPDDAGAGTYRYARDLLGITDSLTIRALEQKIEEAKNKTELMPRREHYAQAKTYLKGRWLPVTLIELYNYLD